MENPLDFSKRSRRALFIFVLLLIVVVMLPRLILLLQKPDNIAFQQNAFQRSNVQQHSWKTTRSYKHYPSHRERYHTPPRRFDPNQYAASEWMQLGLSTKQAAILIKFGKRGFYSDEDLKRVFVISDAFFAAIRDSLVYPPKPEKKAFEYRKETRKETPLLELNLASEEELQQLPGIGEYLARKIVERRTALGGYIRKEQLLEVWKLDSAKLQLIAPRLSVDPQLVRSIAINSMTAAELKQHPYITWAVANSIVKMREQHGPYVQIADIRRSKVIDDALFEKLKPYLGL